MPAELFTAEPLSAPDAILQVLEEAGIDTIFGVPGGHTGHIFNAAESHQNTIRTVLVRQESLAGVMAEVTGRITGKPGVIMGQGSWVLGHGIIGTLEAHLSCSPMLLLTELSDTPGWDLHAPYQAGTGDYGVWDAKKAFEAITKQVFVARDPLTAVHATQLAIKHALSGEPGPVAVLFSRSALLGDPVGPDSFPFLYKTRHYLPPAPPPADPARVAAAATHRLIVRRQRHMFNSISRELPNTHRRVPHNPAYLNLGDLVALGIASGDRIRITSRTASVEAVAEADPNLRRGCVSMSHGFGDLPDENRYDDHGVAVNALLTTDFDLQTVNAMPRMTAVPVNISPAGRLDNAWADNRDGRVLQ